MPSCEIEKLIENLLSYPETKITHTAGTERGGEGMKVKEMPYGEISYWIDRVEKLKETGFTKRAWCEIGNELRQKHGLSERVAVRLMQGNIREAMEIEESEATNGQNQ